MNSRICNKNNSVKTSPSFGGRFLHLISHFTLLACCAALSSCGGRADEITVFKAQSGGYKSYRIPAIAVTPKGTVLAFCEGRRFSRSDCGDIDLLLRRSTDGGRSWGKRIVIRDDGANTCGNPVPIVLADSGRILLLTSWNLGIDTENLITGHRSDDTRRIYLNYSDDDGLTWSSPAEITGMVKAAHWSWYATGPGGAIRIEKGDYAGRIVVPCNHVEAGADVSYSHVIFSDDGGITWAIGGSSREPMVNECQVTELSGGRLLLNMRNYDRTNTQRQVALSDDGGASWRNQSFDPALIEPACHASIRALAWNSSGSRKAVFFINPASTLARENLTLRVSTDECLSWTASRQLHAGPAAYSDIAVLSEKQIGCLYEAGKKNAYERIVFRSIDMERLLE